MNSLEYLGAIGVGKGWMISYRHMCRWNSGFFYKHPRLQHFDWYWRVEPNVGDPFPLPFLLEPPSVFVLTRRDRFTTSAISIMMSFGS